MKENYQLFETTLGKYFNQAHVSGSKLENAKAILIEIKEGTWRNFWNERAVYDLETTEETDRFATFSMYATRSVGKLLVKKKKDGLLVDLMTRYKSWQGRIPVPLTLENSFKVSLN